MSCVDLLSMCLLTRLRTSVGCFNFQAPSAVSEEMCCTNGLLSLESCHTNRYAQ